MNATPESLDQHAGNCRCAIIHEQDSDFGEVTVVNPPSLSQVELLPSQRINSERLSHLSVAERSELLNVLHKFSDVFRETPGLCTLVEHTIPIMESFKPKRLRAYKIPENYRDEVNRQIQEFLRLEFIEPSRHHLKFHPWFVFLKRRI